MNKITFCGSMLLALLLVAHCAPNASLDANDATQIHSIALAGFNDTPYAALSMHARPDPHNQKDFQDAMNTQGLHIGAELKPQVAVALRNAGYQVEENPEAADAILNVNMRVAIYDGGVFDNDFTPDVMLEARLTDRKTGKELFNRRFTYCASASPLNVIVVRSNPKYVFENAESLLAQPALAAEGLRASEPELAQAIASALRRN